MHVRISNQCSQCSPTVPQPSVLAFPKWVRWVRFRTRGFSLKASPTWGFTSRIVKSFEKGNGEPGDLDYRTRGKYFLKCKVISHDSMIIRSTLFLNRYIQQMKMEFTRCVSANKMQLCVMEKF